MLSRLNAAVMAYQQTDPGDPDCGGIRCPGCGLYHTRAAEAVFPLAYEYSLTGKEERLQQALAVADWLFRQQRSDGAWEETPETWTGTTTDQLLMLLLAYPIVRPHLDRKARKTWLTVMERAADYLEGFMDNHNASINYCSTTTATLAEAYLRFGKPSYRAKAMALAHMVVAKMNAESFIEGEGERVGNYRYGVDIGYNMEMSLWGLARYAQLTGDSGVLASVERSAAQHLAFIYPDGMLDGSAGTRSNKWTVYGSGTSDGCHPLFALLSEGHPEYITAAVRNIGRMSYCFSDCGLLGQGPDFDGAMPGKNPCIYPTFTKAKSMAMAHSWVAADTEDLVPLPCDRDCLTHFPSLDIAVIRRGPFCATVTAYGYKSHKGTSSKNMFRPTGGAMSALWVEGFGLLQASSQTEYHRWEPMSFPEMGDVTPLTPRLELRTEEGYWSNLFEFDARFDVGEVAGGVHCRAEGMLKDREQRSCGIPYKLHYRISDGSLVKEYTIGGDTPARIVEPLLYDEGTVIEQSDPRTVTVSGADVSVRIHSPSAALSLDREGAASCRQVYPALRALPLVIGITPGETVCLEYSIVRK